MSSPSVRFREVMTGNLAYGEGNYRSAPVGRGVESRMRLRLTVEVADLDRFAVDPNREASLTGRVDWEPLGGRLPIERGVFNLLVESDDDAGKRMRYRVFIRDGVGHPVTLVGEKRVGAGGFRLWSDTTTLYVRLLSGHIESGDDGGAEQIASGILRLHPIAFAHQLTTFRATGAHGLTASGRSRATLPSSRGRSGGPTFPESFADDQARGATARKERAGQHPHHLPLR